MTKIATAITQTKSLVGGSIYENGISFTEAEYNYAVKRKKSILAFIHEKSMSTEVDALKFFIDKVLKNEPRATFWKDESELAIKVSSSLAGETGEFKTNPQVGWIRGDSNICFSWH